MEGPFVSTALPLRLARLVLAVGFAVAGCLWPVQVGASPFAYLTNPDDNSVTVFDTATDAVVTTIPVGANPLGVAVNAAGTRVYVTNAHDNSVSVIDTVSNVVVATVPVPSGPYGVAVTPTGTKVYVSRASDATVFVIDAVTNLPIGEIPVGGSSLGLAVNPAGTRLYVANSEGAAVAVIDTATDTVVETIPMGAEPFGVAINPGGTRVYVTGGGGVLSVIDAESNSVVTTVPSNGGAVAVNPTGTRVYVSDLSGGVGSVSVVDAVSNTVIATVPVGSVPFGVSVDPAGTRVYVANQNSAELSVIDTASNAVVATLPLSTGPIAFGDFIGPACPGACSDGNACTVDTCTDAQDCAHAPAQNGAPCENDGNSCTIDSCVDASCAHSPVQDGAPCNDANACSQTDVCQAGACIGSNPIVCVAMDTCHDVGSCDPATGACSNPSKADWSICDDGNRRTRTDSCQDGVCMGDRQAARKRCGAICRDFCQVMVDDPTDAYARRRCRRETKRTCVASVRQGGALTCTTVTPCVGNEQCITRCEVFRQQPGVCVETLVGNYCNCRPCAADSDCAAYPCGGRVASCDLGAGECRCGSDGGGGGVPTGTCGPSDVPGDSTACRRCLTDSECPGQSRCCTPALAALGVCSRCIPQF